MPFRWPTTEFSEGGSSFVKVWYYILTSTALCSENDARAKKERPTESMKDELLQNWLTKWGLTSTQGAKVLKIQKSKMSEYLSDTSDRVLPDYIAAHIETFDQLSESKAKKIIESRLKTNL